MDDYNSFKAALASKHQLWEDPDFVPSNKLLASDHRTTRYIKWLRPDEIVNFQSRVGTGDKPKFIVEGASRFDLNQGELGDCWFIAAVACLAVSHEQLLNRCIPPDQDFTNDYAGVFRFNFWRYGKWIEVYVDDRLPTINGRLLYAQNLQQPNEFWVPLLEKAYAKVNGSYDNISGGHTTNALVDFTGGISECIDLRKLRSSPGNLFDTMYAMRAKLSTLACDIESKVMGSRPEYNGLYKGHAYSITNIIRLSSRGQTLRLLRVRNPWGKDEWNGKWSDRSPEWASIPDKTKQDIGMTAKLDGEFWMAFEDFVNSFDLLWMCHLEPDAVSDEIANEKGQSTWDVVRHEAEWVRGFNAGGCGNPPNQDKLWINPQFGIDLKPASGSPDRNVHLVVSLLQESLRLDQNVGISTMLYKVKDGAPRLIDGKNYDKFSLTLAAKPADFINLREVTVHLQVPPGQYVVIPTTFHPNEEAKFLLRIYTETAVSSQHLDLATTISPARSVPEDEISVTFKQFTKGDDQMDAKELVGALNQVFKADRTCFTIDTARSIMAVVDTQDTGLLTLDQFQGICKEITLWKDKFRTFDKDKSGDIDTYELAAVFSSIGLQLSRQVLESIVKRYGGKQRRLNWEDFILCASKITVLYGRFTKFTGKSSAKVELSLEQWLATAV